MDSLKDHWKKEKYYDEFFLAAKFLTTRDINTDASIPYGEYVQVLRCVMLMII